MTQTSTKNDYLFLFRGGVSPKDLSPEQMQQLMNKWFAWIGQMKSRGQYKAGDPLHDEGKVLSGKNGKTVTDGPFVESKETVGGYIIVEAQDMAAAVEIAKGCPIFENNGNVEVRPVQHMPEV